LVGRTEAAFVTNLSQEQVDLDKGIIEIRETNHFKPKSEDSRGLIEIEPEVATQLARLKDNTKQPFVIAASMGAAKSKSAQWYRSQRHFDELLAWLRVKGINELFPLFDLERHKVRRISVTAGWIADSIRYDRNEALDSDSFYGFHVDQLIERGTSTGACLVTRMVESGTWPNAPIIVSHAFEVNELGAPLNLGAPYHLFEGCRRVSYLLAMLRHGLVDANSMHEVLELTLQQES
jgi:hypothetical protein